MPPASPINFGALNLQPQGKPFVPSPQAQRPSPSPSPTGELDEASRSKLDGIVQQMQANKETDANIQAVVDDFKQKYTTPVAPKPIDPLASVHIGGAANTVDDIGNPLGLGSAIKTIRTNVDQVANVLNPTTSLDEKIARSKELPQSSLEQDFGAGLQLAPLVAGGPTANIAKDLGVAAISGASAFGGQAMSENKDARQLPNKRLKVQHSHLHSSSGARAHPPSAQPHINSSSRVPLKKQACCNRIKPLLHF